MVSLDTIVTHVLLSLTLVTLWPCDAQELVAYTRTKDVLMQIFLTARYKREQEWSITELNRGVCPPSLCRAHDENTGKTKPRPKGTGGSVFYQGDIVLDNRMARRFFPEEKRRRKRATVKGKRRLWKNGIVKYKFHKKINPLAKEAIEKGIKHIEKHTCVRFKEKEGGDRDFVRFISEPGCWSQIGFTGGIQLISLGRHCEKVGTAIHEITHALGVWHEQARPDRDKYVKIIDKNVSKRFKSDFAVIDKQASSNRGYPYDYKSIMHYSKYAFTRNGRPTIEVIGIGKKLGMRIGKRSQLSTIDYSQLREMYKCNRKNDEKESVCPKGFKRILLRCYRFRSRDEQQFSPAFASCEKFNADLFTLDGKREEKYVTRYLTRKYPNVTNWRMGARRINNMMMWKLSATRYKNISYSNWAEGHPGSFSSAILKNMGNGRFKWFGEWTGSASQKPKYQHPYICEKTAKRKCVKGGYTDGRDYRGELDHTKGGHTCQKWTERYPQKNELYNQSMEASQDKNATDPDGLGNHNYCRNPKGLRRGRPWCYTTKKKVKWDFCDVSICSKTIRDAEKARMEAERRRRTTTTSRPTRGKSNSATRDRYRRINSSSSSNSPGSRSSRRRKNLRSSRARNRKGRRN